MILPLNPLPLGKLTVATPGTPVGFTSNCQTLYGKPFYNTSTDGAHNGPEDLWAEKLYIRPNPANTGTVYIGFAGMNRSTGQGVILVLSKTDQTFELSMSEGSNKFRVGDIMVDADTGGDNIFASAQVWG